MAKAGYYAVAKGRVPGIYASWEDCEEQVKEYAGARYKKFKTLREAEAFMGVGVYVSSSSPASASTSTLPTASRLPVPPPIASTSLLSVLVPAASGAAKLRHSILNHTKRSVAKRRMSKPVLVTSYGNVSEEGYDVVYADGACKGNGQLGSVAGVGVWWGPNDPRNIAERCPGKQTNNRAELIAIVRVLEEARVHGPLMIKTDSTYSIRCLKEWHQKWAHNDWRTSSGGAVLNAPLIRYILSLLQLRELAGFPVMLVYVKGHAGIEGNEGADWLANVGAMLPERAERDWKEEREKVEGSIKELREGVEVLDKAVQVEPMKEDYEDQGGASVEVGVDVDVNPGAGASVAIAEAVISGDQGKPTTSISATMRTSAATSVISANTGGTTTSTGAATTSTIATSAPIPARDSTTAVASFYKPEEAKATTVLASSTTKTTTSVPALAPDLKAEAKAETTIKSNMNGSGASKAPDSSCPGDARAKEKGKWKAQDEGKTSDVVDLALDDFGADCLLDDDELEKEMAEA